MSDAKPRRGGREAARHEAAAGEAMAPAAPPVTTGPAEPETGRKAAPEAAPPPPPEPHAMANFAAAPAPAPGPVGESAEPSEHHADDAWAALAEMQAALARGCEEIAAEMATLTRSNIAAATDAATAMLDARTFAEAVEISALLIRRRTDAMIEGSTKLSEIGMQAATAASRPILSRLAAGWSGAGYR